MSHLSVSSIIVCLPVIGYMLLLAILRWRGSCWRSSAIHAAIIWGVAVILITEVLSRPHWLTRPGFACAWLTIDLILALTFWRLSKREEPIHTAGEESLSGSLPGTDRALLSGVGIIALLTLITTLAAPPNTHDVMTYHLPRVVYWLQNRSVDFFPTDDERQIHQPPGAEYGVLHLHVLSGTDRFDGIIQWLGFVLSVVTVSLIAGRLGANRRTQIFAATFCAAIPQGISQATGGKNDYVCAFLLAAMVYYLLAFKDKPAVAIMLGIGGSLGLAVMTKGTAYFFAPPLLAITLTWPKFAWTRAIKLAPAGLALAMALNVGHWTRNYRLVGTPFGNREIPYANEIITPATVFSNLLRNAALHLWTPRGRGSGLIERVIARTVQAVGADVNDPRTTFPNTVFRIQNLPFDESLTGNTWHFLLILVALAAIAFTPGLRRTQWAYVLGLAGAFFLFCAMLRWQPWHVRLHLPLFVLSAVPVSLFLASFKRSSIILGVGCALLLLALPWALHNEQRSLLPWANSSVFNHSREELYFARQDGLMAEYASAVAEVKKRACSEVSIDSSLDSYEYPLLEMLGATHGSTRVRHTGVTRPSRIYAEVGAPARPCVVVCLRNSAEKAQFYISRGMSALPFRKLAVFIPNSDGSP